MKVLNIGSMNLDYVYSVKNITIPGETQSSYEMNIYLGGKGMNQSVALAKAGVKVFHGGMIGEDGAVFLETCKEYNIDTRYVKTIPCKTGHAIIQVDRNGQNSILLYGGANHKLTKQYIDEVLHDFGKNDILLLQNEVNLLPYIVEHACEKGIKIILNPSPYNDQLGEVDLNKVSIFILNEIEGKQLTGKTETEEIIDRMLLMYPNAQIVLTLGSEGAVYADGQDRIYQPCFKVNAVDTTAAGDTFTGYFLAGLVEKMPIEKILEMSAKASSITVTRSGAIQSIPLRNEVNIALMSK